MAKNGRPAALSAGRLMGGERTFPSLQIVNLGHGELLGTVRCTAPVAHPAPKLDDGNLLLVSLPSRLTNRII
jgi:hypothetical protein